MLCGQVARVADFGQNDNTLTTLTHLGNVLHPGDRVLGYDLAHANLVDDAVDAWLLRPSAQLPDVVLVRAALCALNPIVSHQLEAYGSQLSGVSGDHGARA